MTDQTEWQESPDNEWITLEDKVELQIVVSESNPHVIDVTTQWGTKHEVELDYPEQKCFRTGSKWLKAELQRNLDLGERNFTLYREGFKIRYRVNRTSA